MGRPYPNIFFAAYGFGPYECFFCRERNIEFGSRFHIHHINGDPKNNHPLNLAPAHNSCHRRWHVLVEASRTATTAQAEEAAFSTGHPSRRPNTPNG